MTNPRQERTPRVTMECRNCEGDEPIGTVGADHVFGCCDVGKLLPLEYHKANILLGREIRLLQFEGRRPSFLETVHAQ